MTVTWYDGVFKTTYRGEAEVSQAPRPNVKEQTADSVDVIITEDLFRIKREEELRRQREERDKLIEEGRKEQEGK